MSATDAVPPPGVMPLRPPRTAPDPTGGSTRRRQGNRSLLAASRAEDATQLSASALTWHPGWSEPDVSPEVFEIVVTHPAVGMTIVQVVGALDINTCPELDLHLDHELRTPGCAPVRDVILDLTRLTLLSAAGVRSTLRAEAISRDEDVRLQLVITRPALTRVLTLCHLDDRLRVQPNLTTAIRAAS